LADAIAQLPPKAIIHLAVPTHMALLERLTLPSTDRDELRGMVQLQLEKTLPYPVEEVAHDFEVLDKTDSEATLVSIAVHEPAMVELCKPLHDARRIPQQITVFGQHVAAVCPPEEVVLAMWEEQEQVVVAVCEKGKLVWAQLISTKDPETVSLDLPRVLLTAEMEGVTTGFTRVLLGDTLAELKPVISEAVAVPVEPLALDGKTPDTNLLPESWLSEARGFERNERIKGQLMTVAVVYLLLLAGAFVYLAWTKRRVQMMDAELAALQPQLADIQAQQAKWEALAPAIDPRRYPVELLFQAQNARPSPDLRITVFDTGLAQFMVEGEAPSAAVAIAYSEKLKSEPELSSFRIEMPNPPAILPNEHAQFRIFGRL
jgi:hypothetical protein